MKEKVKVFICNTVKVNAYVVNDELGNCIIIDPGCASGEEIDTITTYITEEGLTPLAILLTHGHFDHILGVPFLRQHYNIKCWLHPGDNEELVHALSFSRVYENAINKSFEADCFMNDDEILLFGKLDIRVIHIPGHTAGSVCLYNESNHWLFTGDTLMKGSLCFTNNSYAGLLSLLKERIFPLPADTLFFFGHGPSSSMEEEKVGNPFFVRFRS